MDGEQLLKLIKERRSIRKFTAEPVSKDHLRMLVEAALWAPSACNAQAWYVDVVTCPKRIAEIKLVSPGMYGDPTAVMVVCSDQVQAKAKWADNFEVFSLTDTAMASQNVLLLAHALGLGGCVIRSFNQAAVAELLDLGDRYRPELVIALGHPVQQPAPRRRRPREEVCGYNE